MSSTARRLLVATPILLDPNFFRTVVFMIEHTPEAALGVVLNRPSDAILEDAVPEWCALAAEPRVAFVGGPVQPHEAVIGLGRTRSDGEPAEGWYPLLGAVGTVDLGRAPADVRPTSKRSGCSRVTPPGGRGSSTASSRSTAGTSSTRRPTTSSPPSPTRCGAACCAARAASSRSPRTSRSTLEQLTPHRDQPSMIPRNSAASAVTPLSAPKRASPRRDRARVCTNAVMPDAATTTILTTSVVP